MLAYIKQINAEKFNNKYDSNKRKLINVCVNNLFISNHQTTSRSYCSIQTYPKFYKLSIGI